MASRKEDLLEENRTDSGIDSYRSILKSEEPREPSTDFSGPRDKFSNAEERLDSAYGSSSITVESLSEIVEDCTISSANEEQAQTSELSEQDENLLGTLTEDGDTYVSGLFSPFLYVKAKLFAELAAVSAERPLCCIRLKTSLSFEQPFHHYVSHVVCRLRGTQSFSPASVNMF